MRVFSSMRFSSSPLNPCQLPACGRHKARTSLLPVRLYLYTRRCSNAKPTLGTLAQHRTNMRAEFHVSVELRQSSIFCQDHSPVEILPADTTRQTRDIQPMLGQCWTDVVDGGPTLIQHWFVFAGEFPAQRYLNTGQASTMLAWHLGNVVSSSLCLFLKESFSPVSQKGVPGCYLCEHLFTLIKDTLRAWFLDVSSFRPAWHCPSAGSPTSTLLRYCALIVAVWIWFSNIKNPFFISLVVSQQTQNICITFVQRRPNVFDFGPTLYKCYTIFLCLLG